VFRTKAFAFAFNKKRFRGKNFKLLHNLMRELTKQLREDITTKRSFLLCFAGSDKSMMVQREESFHLNRYYCSVCGNHFCDSKNPFYRKQYPEAVILCSLVLYYELERSPEEISRTVGIPVKEGMKHPTTKTIDNWMKEYSYHFAIIGIHIKGEFREADELYKSIDRIIILLELKVGRASLWC